jgi:2-C-methyl-D-erythritol 4-phosphate cytidylyltransferase/2-C-methyl-D-erythritol 2,4-cyclodiphosphate synthase
MSGSYGKVGVVLVAAGTSSRMKGTDKQVADLRGWPVFLHSLKVFDLSDAAHAVSVVFSESNIKAGREAIESAGLRKVVATITGGARRQDSVRLGIEALIGASGDLDFIAVHDGARPFVDEEMLLRGLEAAAAAGASVAAVRVKDTIKEAGDDGAVAATPDRSRLWAVQTPQVFRAAVLIEAHRSVLADVTDDASMVERAGGAVTVFEGDYDNIKITTPGDLAIAEAIYDRRSGQPAGNAPRRWGIGFDGHKLVPGGPLKLGNVEIEFDHNLEGHSDGDVLLHAIASAFLGAAGLGDMGSNFPSSDQSLRGIDSADLLKRALRKLADRGWAPERLDATIIAQRPRLSAHVPAIRDRIAGIAGLEREAVNIKVTSTDHVGAIGEGQGIAAQAIATICLR